MVDYLGIEISTADIIDLLRRDLKLTAVCRQILSLSIIHDEAAARSLEVTEGEIQAEGERLRREMRLESAEKTLAWLDEQQLSAAEWEESIRDHLLTKKLADALFKETAKVQFEQNKLDYEQVALHRIVVENAQIAQELSYQLEENEINFFEAAHLYDIDPVRRAYCGYEGEKSRWALDPDIAASVFGANPQEVIGPFSLEEGHVLYFVDRFITPELTDEIYQEIRDRKFRQWLETEIQRLQP